MNTLQNTVKIMTGPLDRYGRGKPIKLGAEYMKIYIYGSPKLSTAQKAPGS